MKTNQIIKIRAKEISKTGEAAYEKTIAVVGLGYVGLPLAILADKKGYKVMGIDTSERKVAAINRKQSPFKDRRIEEAMPGINFKADVGFEKVRDSSVVIICVPTPVFEDHTPNLEPVKNASRLIAPHLSPGSIVILESTVNPGVSETVVLPILEEISGLKSGVDFSLAHCPERINPGDGIWSVENIPRVVGALDKSGLKRALDFYRSIIDAEIKPMKSLKEAEAVKVVENSFRDINIAFVNELAMSFSKMGIDLINVIEGATTKPFSFMAHYPGAGVGGHCIPVDPYYLIAYGEKNGFHHDFLLIARRINNEMPKFVVELAVSALNEKQKPMKGSTVAVLGLAYKPDIDDYRESPAFEIIKELKSRGANVRIFDPYIKEHSTSESVGEALENADAAVIVTGHSEFKKLTYSDFKRLGVKTIIDGRNIYPKELFIRNGIVYKGIGR